MRPRIVNPFKLGQASDKRGNLHASVSQAHESVQRDKTKGLQWLHKMYNVQVRLFLHDTNAGFNTLTMVLSSLYFHKLLAKRAKRKKVDLLLNLNSFLIIILKSSLRHAH